MSFEEVLNLIIKLILVPLIPLLGILARAWVQKQIELLQKELESKELQDFGEYLIILEDIVSSVILSIQQTYVEQLKKDNAWTVERQKEAFEIARQRVEAQLTEKGRVLLEKGLGDYEEFLDDLIESYVQGIPKN